MGGGALPHLLSWHGLHRSRVPVSGWMCVCVCALQMNWHPTQDVSLLKPNVPGIDSTPTVSLIRFKWIMKVCKISDVFRRNLFITILRNRDSVNAIKCNPKHILQNSRYCIITGTWWSLLVIHRKAPIIYQVNGQLSKYCMCFINRGVGHSEPNLDYTFCIYSYCVKFTSYEVYIKSEGKTKKSDYTDH